MPDPKPPPRPEATLPRRDFERYMGPLGKKWYAGGCVRSGCLAFVVLPFLAGLLLLLALPWFRAAP